MSQSSKQDEEHSSGKIVDVDEIEAGSLENENKKIHYIFEDIFDNVKKDIQGTNVSKSKKIHQTSFKQI